VGRSHPHNWIKEEGADTMSVGDQYLISVYWVVTTMTTVGYGDISAVNGYERGFSIFVMVNYHETLDWNCMYGYLELCVCVCG
jgi:hypothetical protein